jgi:hypothetical protein
MLVQMWRRLLPSMRLTQYGSSLRSSWFQVRPEDVVDDRLLLSNKVKVHHSLKSWSANVVMCCRYAILLPRISVGSLLI